MKSSIQILTSNFDQLIANYNHAYARVENGVGQHKFLSKIYVNVQLRGPLNMQFPIRMNVLYDGKFARVNYQFHTIKVLLFCAIFCLTIGGVFYLAWTSWFGFALGGIFAIIIYRAIWNKIILAIQKFEKELRKNA